MGLDGLEPSTSRLSGVRSNQLSYRPDRREEVILSKLNKVSCVQVSVRLSVCFLRKEVIQPQVLLRLPCYDFTPIADPTLGRFLSCESDHALWVLPTLMV